MLVHVHDLCVWCMHVHELQLGACSFDILKLMDNELFNSTSHTYKKIKLYEILRFQHPSNSVSYIPFHSIPTCIYLQCSAIGNLFSITLLLVTHLENLHQKLSYIS